MNSTRRFVDRADSEAPTNMKSEKLANTLDKFVEKIEALSLKSSDTEKETDFDSMKADVISLLNEMSELAHDDAENESEEE